MNDRPESPDEAPHTSPDPSIEAAPASDRAVVRSADEASPPRDSLADADRGAADAQFELDERSGPEFTAWEIHEPTGFRIEPASTDRDWMDATDQRFAYRCLPLVIANQSGWIVRSPTAIAARWSGGPTADDVRLKFFDGRPDARICSHFGAGVLTFTLPFLFRTPPGMNLWVKGPSNCVKDGLQPLEGVVESDWLDATFTMNWKFTRPGVTVRFEAGEPFCMLVPVPRGLLDSLVPRQRPIGENPELQRAYERWKEARQSFNTGIRELDPDVVKAGWQRDYMLGRDSQGRPFGDHQTKLRLRPFQRSTDA